VSLWKKEWEARIELIRSVAQSQKAMARILGSVADSAEQLPGMSKSICENIRLLTQLQAAMTETVTGVRIRRSKKGVPGKPWLRSTKLSTARGRSLAVSGGVIRAKASSQQKDKG